MRRVIWLIGVVCVVFCGWWAIASLIVTSRSADWLDARRVDGWQAEAAAIRSRGFPFEIKTVLERLSLADPDAGLAVELPRLTLSARTIWPGDLKALLPNDPIRLATPQGTANVVMETAQADLNLAPGTALELENLSFTSGPFRLMALNGGLLAGDSSELRMAQSLPNTYDITLKIGQFAPGSVPRTKMLVPDDWPLVFTALGAQATVRFDSPWDRRAIEDRRPQPQHIALSQSDVTWGEVRLRLVGAVEIDARGVPDGDVTIRAENWQSILQLGENAGLLVPEMRQTLENVLTSLAAGSGQTNDLDVTLRFERGLIWAGFLPLGPAPRLVLR